MFFGVRLCGLSLFLVRSARVAVNFETFAIDTGSHKAASATQTNVDTHTQRLKKGVVGGGGGVNGQRCASQTG